MGSNNREIKMGFYEKHENLISTIVGGLLTISIAGGAYFLSLQISSIKAEIKAEIKDEVMLKSDKKYATKEGQDYIKDDLKEIKVLIKEVQKDIKDLNRR